MSQVTIDAPLSEKLRALASSVELVDAAGRVLGRYIPETVDSEPPMSAEELERRRKEPGGRSLAEIQADLEKRV